jgi:hypothetical protein
MEPQQSYVTGLHHIAIRAVDFDQTLNFFTKGLGYTPYHEWALQQFNLRRAAMLKSPDGQNYLEIFDNEANIAAQGRQRLDYEPLYRLHCYIFVFLLLTWKKHMKRHFMREQQYVSLHPDSSWVILRYTCIMLWYTARMVRSLNLSSLEVLSDKLIILTFSFWMIGIITNRITSACLLSAIKPMPETTFS